MKQLLVLSKDGENLLFYKYFVSIWLCKQMLILAYLILVQDYDILYIITYSTSRIYERQDICTVRGSSFFSQSSL